MSRLKAEERWELIERISKRVVLRGKYEHTLKDVISDLSVKPATGIPLAIAVLYGFWAFFRAFAGFFTDGLAAPFFNGYYLPAIQKAFPGGAATMAGSSPLYAIFVGDPAAKNCFEALGVLTSGLFVAFGVVLPAVAAFYLLLTILEDVGYLPRLAALADTLFHKMGLHGFAIVPTVLSLGCNVPGVCSCRVLETRKQRFMMMALLSVFIPCAAQLGVMQELIPQYTGLILIYLFFGFFTMGILLSRLIPGRSPELLLDVPPYRAPQMRNVLSKVEMRVRGFLTAIPLVLSGVLLVNLLYWLGVIDWLAGVTEPIFVTWFGVPPATVRALVMAFMRKDMAVGMLGGLASAGLLTTGQLITSVVLVSIYFPCLATFIMVWREGGTRDLLKALAVMLASFFIYGGLMHAIVAVAGV